MADKVTNKNKMVEIKTISTFFQCAQITTLVKIPWPAFSLYFPFALPYGDISCLTNQLSWNSQHSLFAAIYATILAATLLNVRARHFPTQSLKRREAYQQLMFFVLLAYSPLVQSAVLMFSCADDAAAGWVLVADPRVSCEESWMRGAIRVHAVLTVVLVGLGLPAFILNKMMTLREHGELTADSIYAGFFEWYEQQGRSDGGVTPESSAAIPNGLRVAFELLKTS